MPGVAAIQEEHGRGHQKQGQRNDAPMFLHIMLLSTKGVDQGVRRDAGFRICLEQAGEAGRSKSQNPGRVLRQPVPVRLFIRTSCHVYAFLPRGPKNTMASPRMLVTMPPMMY